MFRLAMMLYAVIGTTLAGSGVVGVLAAGYDGMMPILVSAGIGAVLGFPLSFYVARKMIAN